MLIDSTRGDSLLPLLPDEREKKTPQRPASQGSCQVLASVSVSSREDSDESAVVDSFVDGTSAIERGRREKKVLSRYWTEQASRLF